MALMVKKMPANAGDAGGKQGFDPWVGRSPGGGPGNPVFLPGEKRLSILPMDRGPWQPTVHGVAKSQTQPKQLNTDLWNLTFHLHSLKIMPRISD